MCPACDSLLTWSEPVEYGDIIAGEYIIEKSRHWQARDGGTHYTAMQDNRNIGKFKDLALAKDACEKHARKMLGWKS